MSTDNESSDKRRLEKFLRSSYCVRAEVQDEHQIGKIMFEMGRAVGAKELTASSEVQRSIRVWKLSTVAAAAIAIVLGVISVPNVLGPWSSRADRQEANRTESKQPISDSPLASADAANTSSPSKMKRRPSPLESNSRHNDLGAQANFMNRWPNSESTSVRLLAQFVRSRDLDLALNSVAPFSQDHRSGRNKGPIPSARETMSALLNERGF